MLTTRLATLAAVAALSTTLAFAQQTPPPPAQAPAPDPHAQQHGRPGGPGGPAMGQGMQARGGRGEDRHEGMRGGGMRGEGRIVPPGMWWKNPELATRIGLTPDQTRKMDDIFQSSRLKLIDLKANVEKQEVTLEPMLDANPLETKAVMAQIARVADARAELEKANAGMLLGLRAVLTPDQWTKLHSGDHGPRHPGMGMLQGPATPSPAMGPAMAMAIPPIE